MQCNTCSLFMGRHTIKNLQASLLEKKYNSKQNKTRQENYAFSFSGYEIALNLI